MEYGLLIAGIAALIVAVVFFFGGAVADLFDNTCDSVGTGSGGTMSCDTPVDLRPTSSCVTTSAGVHERLLSGCA